MAQGVLGRKNLNGQFINPAARSVSDALRAGRYQAWARARTMAFNRSFVYPAAAFRLWVVSASEPVLYKLWRLCAALAGFLLIIANSVALYVSGLAFGARARTQSVRAAAFKRAQSALVLAGLSVVVFTYGFYGMGLEVFIDGESLGYVNSQEQFERAVTSVSAQASEILNVPFSISTNATFRYSLVSRSKVFNGREVENMLFSRIPELKTMDVLMIDGEAVAGVEQRGIISEKLDAMLTEHLLNYDSVGFAADVSVVRRIAPVSIEITADGLDGILYSELNQAVTVFAEEGADVEEFAMLYGMTAARLFEMNPDIEDISEQTLTISHEKPLLQIISRREEVYTETVYYETEYVADPNMYTTSTRVVTEGADGYNTITADVGYTDGREVSRDITLVLHTVEPVTEVIATGTMTPPTFIRPFYGKVSSNYGMRKLFGRTSMHTGVDFAGKIGSPIVASSDGTVKFVGTKTGYGLCIIIKHADGIETLYGHNSSNLVKVGDKVKQGDLIARVGNTGRSTGPHVHFEIIVNGKTVNPFNYLK
ncbi:MAG: peptidoglycan DD-metalloendopeptidase family protein [Oscillospiraceae bacterium]|nr:peptidoglycan DD-metalloendopeptidase family protein [Oscillospiraceae bacterium]